MKAVVAVVAAAAVVDRRVVALVSSTSVPSIFNCQVRSRMREYAEAARLRILFATNPSTSVWPSPRQLPGPLRPYLKKFHLTQLQRMRATHRHGPAFRVSTRKDQILRGESCHMLVEPYFALPNYSGDSSQPSLSEHQDIGRSVVIHSDSIK